MENYQILTRGFQVLNQILAPYVCREIQAQYKKDWWQQGILGVLRNEQIEDLPSGGDWSTCVDSLDIARSLILIDLNWNNIFRLQLSKEERNWVKELITTRNKWAHKGGGDFPPDDTWRALDTMARLLEHLDAEATESIRELARTVRYGTPGASTENGFSSSSTSQTPTGPSSGILESTPRSGLLPWRKIIEPHPDVAQGRYRQAEFVVDLSHVLRGKAEMEYQDPIEFFGRTYITSGMAGLLEQSIRRVSGKGGEPVIQLKTSFGGGKTHSMLALYHLLRGQVLLDKMSNARPIIEKVGVAECPKVNVAVLVGTALNPTMVRKPTNFPGITIRTLWGEMVAQLSEQAKNPKLYDFIKEADKKAVPPGSDTLQAILDACGPCLILIDELVAYTRKLYKVEGLPAGTFDAVLSFVHELTEATRKSKNSLLVATIPESETEIGGEAGKIVTDRLEQTFGRMEAIWKPVGAEEGFEIVRRRLFLPVHDFTSQEDVCRAFSKMYQESSQDFPAECRELSYFERLKSSYPIHPEVFDRLYDDWSTLERFQKTRGVLRLLAAVIHDLWVRGDSSFLIMPGCLPLDTNVIRDELTRYLDDGWNAVIETDVDGPRSAPYQLDAENPRFGQLVAARRVARTIFLGSAPSVKQMKVRGIEDIRMRLGVVQPGEPIAVFNDVLGRLQEKLTHLYSSGQRYWYDLPPNLRRTVEDRALQFEEDDIVYEIEQRLKSERERGDFNGIHSCPASSMDVPDEQSVRLVVLGPKSFHKTGEIESPALVSAKDILEHRGAGPRLYRNMLIFVAPDREFITALEQETRRYLAWKSVVKDTDALNLDSHQLTQAKENLNRSNETVALRLREAYSWLLVPSQDNATDPINFDAKRISGGESWVQKASHSVKQSEQLIKQWHSAHLVRELDTWLWKEQDYIQVKKVWEALTSYCYFYRLKNDDILLNTISQGLESDEYFGYAVTINDDGKFLGLFYGNQGEKNTPTLSGYLLKPSLAKAELTKKGHISIPQPSTPLIENGGEGRETFGGDQTKPPVPPTIPTPVIQRFHGTVELDVSRVGRDAGQIAEEIIQHLSVIPGAKVTVTLEIDAHVSHGIPDKTMRIVNENCQTLKFRNHGFEEE
jgi:predicted AAA+ superfamily ATPase